jgi:hypothetical protein
LFSLLSLFLSLILIPHIASFPFLFF